MRVGMVGLAVATAAAALAGFGLRAAAFAEDPAAPAEKLRAKELEIVDAQGRVRVRLGSVETDPGMRDCGLELRDAEGRPRATLSVRRDGSQVLWMRDSVNPSPLVSLSVSPEGQSVFELRGREEGHRLYQRVVPTGQVRIFVLGRDGNVVERIGSSR
jgi:hypothetical protein